MSAVQEAVRPWQRRIVAAVLDLPDEEPEVIARHIGYRPVSIERALRLSGHRDRAAEFYRVAQPRSQDRLTRDEVLAEVEMLADLPAAEVCRRLGMKPGAVAAALKRVGRKDLARPFWKLHWDERRRELPPLAPGDHRHGTRTGYGWYRCRCRACRTWNAGQTRRLRALRKLRAAGGAGADPGSPS